MLMRSYFMLMLIGLVLTGTACAQVEVWRGPTRSVVSFDANGIPHERLDSAQSNTSPTNTGAAVEVWRGPTRSRVTFNADGVPTETPERESGQPVEILRWHRTVNPVDEDGSQTETGSIEVNPEDLQRRLAPRTSGSGETENTSHQEQPGAVEVLRGRQRSLVRAR